MVLHLEMRKMYMCISCVGKKYNNKNLNSNRMQTNKNKNSNNGIDALESVAKIGARGGR